MSKVAIATTQPDGYWALGARWSTAAAQLDVVESPSDPLPDDLTMVGVPDGVRRFHQRAGLIAAGQIALEDVRRAKEDPRLVVIHIGPPATGSMADAMQAKPGEIMTQASIAARADEQSAIPRKATR